MKIIKLLILLLLLKITGVYAQTVIQGEYFYDDRDSGIGSCRPFALSAVPDSTWNLSFNTTGLSNGTHKLYIRLRDDNGKWGHVVRRNIEVYQLQRDSVLTGEWFVDNRDNGYGACNPITISNPDSTILQSLVYQLTDFPILTEGNHMLYFRTKDNHGKWSHTVRYNLYRGPETSTYYVVNLESFTGANDNGYGACDTTIFLPLTPDDICADIRIPIHKNTWSSLDTVFVRVKDSLNGRWSHTVRLQNDALGRITCAVNINEQNILSSGVSIYPNPSNGNFTIQKESYINSNVQMTIYSISGELIVSQKLEGYVTSMNLALSPGLYFVNLQTEKYRETKKLVIQ